MEDIHGGGCKEFRVFGPPGTGKTTWLVKQVRGCGEIRRREGAVLLVHQNGGDGNAQPHHAAG